MTAERPATPSAVASRVGAEPPQLQPGHRVAVEVQSAVARLAAPVVVPAIATALGWGLRYRVRDHRDVRRRLRRELATAPGPVLIAANHLTMIDSAILAWAVAPSWWYVLRTSKLPWNLPERRNFAASLPARVLAYLCKCLPITRGGDRQSSRATLAKLAHLMASGQPALVFPEGRRSRTSRVDRSEAAHGVGWLVKSTPGCRVLCLYLRGDDQRGYSFLPSRGETFTLLSSWLEPETRRAGMRASVEITDQILTRLEELESEYFDGRQ